MNLSCPRPGYRARPQDPRQVEDFLKRKFPMIQRVAQKRGAAIAVADATGLRILTRSGRTGGEVNSPPTVTVNQQRGGYNGLSAVTAKGEVLFDLEEKTINGKRDIAFLEKMLNGRTRPLLVIAANATFHRSQEVRDFVRSHRHPIRLFFFPTSSPKLNPAAPVWKEVKHRKLQKQPIKNKSDLQRRIEGALNF